MSMQWKRVGAIGMVLLDEITLTVFYFLVLPLFDVHLPLTLYGAVMGVLVVKDIIVIKLIWNIVVSQPRIGKESLLGRTGIVYADFDTEGIVQIGNEFWKAKTVQPVKKGEKVTVLRIHGLVLDIEPVSGNG